MSIQRRTFLLGAALSAVAASAGASEKDGRKPSSVGYKFNADGSPCRFPGNTIVSHVPLGTPLSDALTSVRDTLAAGSYAACLALLPPSSYHMTVFEGVTERSRREGPWPDGASTDAPLADINRELERRLEGFDLDCPLPLRMRLDEFNLRRDPGATLRLLPVDEQENRKLRRLRDRLAQRLQLRAPNHEAYGFHISLAYLIDWMTPEQTSEYAAVQAECFKMLQQRVPVIELGAPEYCVFYDMLAFDTQFRVGQGRRRITR